MTREEAIYCMKSYLPDDNYEHCTKCKYYKTGCESSKAHTMAIKALEEQKTGKWEYTPHTAYPTIGSWCCPECNNVLIEYGLKNIPPLYKYCPWCGAKMEVEE